MTGWIYVLMASAWVAGLLLFTTVTARRAEALAPPIGDFLRVGGARLHYQDRGTGPAVVMLHGWGGNLRHFHRLADALAATCRVVAVDLPGYGYSVMQSGEHPPLRAQATLVAGFIRTLGLQQPVLLGHSLGGAVALALALDQPDCVRALVLVSPLSRAQRLKGMPIRSHALQWLVGWFALAPLGRLFWRSAQRSAFAPDAIPSSFDAAGGAVLGLRPGNFIAACKDRATAEAELAQMEPRYSSLAIPVEVVFGRDDSLLDVRLQGEGLAESLPHATLHLVDGGHMLPLTAPEPIADVIMHYC